MNPNRSLRSLLFLLGCTSMVALAAASARAQVLAERTNVPASSTPGQPLVLTEVPGTFINPGQGELRAPGLERQGQGQGPAAPVQGPHKTTAEMQNAEFFLEQYSHLTPHVLFEPPLSPDPKINQAAAFYNVNLFQLIALALILVLFVPVKQSFGQARPNVVIRVLRGWVHWIRDEMVYATMGKEEGKKFAPYLCYLFFFIALMNVLGLVPIVGVTATATPYVTGALALCTFIMMVGGGIREQGFVAFFVNLLPHGMPKALIPLMAVVEVIGLLVRPFALMIRLFANMLAGHLVIYSFIGLIFLFAKMLGGGVLPWGTAVPAVLMAVFIYIIESFIVLLQAYIFTYLSIIFVQLSLHPEH